MKALLLTLVLVTTLAAAPPPAKPAAQPVAPIFVTSDRCMACHNGLIAPSGQDVSIGYDWSVSMMANAAKDPYWQAAVRREITEHPTASAAIQNECSACHMPMNQYMAKLQGKMGQVVANLPVNLAALNPAPGALLAWDSVSCSVCHQILKDKLGTPASFTAGFVIDAATPLGQRPAFGPFTVDKGRKRIMSSASQLQPTLGAHVQEAGLCGSCHTLYTHALGPDGKQVGRLPEQVPFLEWKHSGFYAKGQTCQDCHMPAQPTPVAASSVLGQERSPFFRHTFQGGNFFMLGLLQQHALALGVTAQPMHLQAKAAATRKHLDTKSAKVTLEGVRLAGKRLEAKVRLSNLAGHKLPTAYPSRRAWLRFTVRDAQGKVVFSSGALRPDGSIAGNDNDADPRAYEPHHLSVSSPDQVQIYEAIMADTQGAVTTGLIRAVRYIKDTRLLPQGFDKATAHTDIAVQGPARQDPDFVAGGDLVAYSVPVDPAAGPFTVSAELWYQPIGFRWAMNLKQVDAPETKRFVGYYQAAAQGSAHLLAQDSGRTP
ncbi:MAG: NapC/NirT family cytochrome c [Desulfarculaceae bacterium]|nr:NapC/NirT family cytochrome c [Desulfarculaceae bacterium]MCF8072304.1 NapC/NirT family cytochrome c [Desulfarculaceae bacterium]MCF8100225.1 NapC/NirT family cytochrome c [Desulfarculaceae bacterium]